MGHIYLLKCQVNCVLKINCFEDNEVKRNGVGKKMKSCAIVLVFLSFIFQQIRRISGGNGEPFGEKGQKNYENEEEGKIIPHRTFLTTVEIVVICVFTVILVFALIALMIYLYIYGCTKAPWCQRRSKDYSQIQLQRDKKIGEIWKSEHGHQNRDRV